MKKLLAVCLALQAINSIDAGAAQSVSLPTWVCAHPDAIFVNEFDVPQNPIPSNASDGSGGAAGSTTHTLHIAGLGSGTQTYYLYVPSTYTASHPMPFVLVLHGYVQYGTQNSAAQTIRNDWSSIAASGQFIVAAPVGNDIVYQDGSPYGVSWLVPPTSGPNDYDLFAAVLADVESRFNVERTRIYGWGFSAGGHVMHDLGINDYSAAFNASTMAAYSVSSGVLADLACLGMTTAECANALAALPRKIPVDSHIGTSDPNYSYATSDHTLFLSQGWADNSTFFFNTFAGDHTYTTSDLQLAWTHLCPNAVTP
jgi:poly(3-hydroxybutyrate) depolymerase